MSNISLKQLEVFVTVADCGSFTEAGRKLYLSQSTVSSHISALEESLGTVLIRRDVRRHIALTADGKRVYQYAKDVLIKCDALEEAVSGPVRRELVIGASAAPSKNLLPQHIFRFANTYPECCCVVKNGSSEQIQKMVLEGDVQIGFVGSTDNHQALHYEKVAEDRLVLITPNTPRFAALHASGVLGRTLLGEPMIFRDMGSGTQKMINNYLSSREVDLRKVKVKYYISNPELLQELVATGAGVSILSALSVQDRVCEGKLLAFELESAPLRRNIYMVTRKNSGLSELGKAFVAQVQKSV